MVLFRVGFGYIFCVVLFYRLLYISLRIGCTAERHKGGTKSWDRVGGLACFRVAGQQHVWRLWMVILCEAVTYVERGAGGSR